MKYICLILSVMITVHLNAQEMLFDTTTMKVIVQGQRNSYKKNLNNSALKIKMKQLEIPLIVEAIPRQLLKDQGIRSFDDGMKNAVGITKLWNATGRNRNGAEYYSMRGFDNQAKFINGRALNSNLSIDPIYIETIDVLKGPTGTLYGGFLINYGGLINITTKQPYAGFGGSIGYRTGSFGLHRLTLDINEKLSPKTFFRINMAATKEKSFQDAGFSESIFLAPGLKWQPSNKFFVLVEGIMNFSNAQPTSVWFFNRSKNVNLQGNSMIPFEKNYRLSFTNNALSIKNHSLGLLAEVNYQFAKKWQLQSLFSMSFADSKGYYANFQNEGKPFIFHRKMAYYDNDNTLLHFQQNLITSFRIKKITQKLLMGIDYLEVSNHKNNTDWLNYGQIKLLEESIEKKDTTSEALKKENIDAYFKRKSVIKPTYWKNQSLGAYLSAITKWSPRLSTMISMRMHYNLRLPPSSAEYATRYGKISQLSFSPKFGIVYQPIKNKLSLFANCMNGFKNIMPKKAADSGGTNHFIRYFIPEQAKQAEIGIKANLFNDKLGFTIAVYNIRVTHRVMTHPDNIYDFYQGGIVNSKGIELSTAGTFVNGWAIFGGISFNDTKVVKDNSNKDNYLGLRPENAGAPILVNFWTTYKFPKGWLRKLKIGVGANYTHKSAPLNRKKTGKFELPAHTILNTSITYTWHHFDFNFKIDNLINKKYYVGWTNLAAQKPRSLEMGVRYNF